eukprot:11482890-Ditylum_brightwellii.AAC.1
MTNVSLLPYQKLEGLTFSPSQNMHCICLMGCMWVIVDLWCSGKHVIYETHPTLYMSSSLSSQQNTAMPLATASDMISLPLLPKEIPVHAMYWGLEGRYMLFEKLVEKMGDAAVGAS